MAPDKFTCFPFVPTNISATSIRYCSRPHRFHGNKLNHGQRYVTQFWRGPGSANLNNSTCHQFRGSPPARKPEQFSLSALLEWSRDEETWTTQLVLSSGDPGARTPGQLDLSALPAVQARGNLDNSACPPFWKSKDQETWTTCLPF